MGGHARDVIESRYSSRHPKRFRGSGAPLLVETSVDQRFSNYLRDTLRDRRQMTHKGKIAVCIVFGRLDYRERRLLSVEPLAAMFKNDPSIGQSLRNAK